MKKTLSFLAAASMFLNASSVTPVKFGEIYPFEENGKWGLMVNDEVCLLPTFDRIRKAYDCFVFSENGKEGIMDPVRILVPAVCDRIVSTGRGSGSFYEYMVSGEKGLAMVNPVRKYVNISGDRITDTICADIVRPGQYKAYVTNSKCSQASFDNLVIYQAHDGSLGIKSLDDGVDYTEFCDLKKLGGNIKKVMDGKVPFSELKIKEISYKFIEKLQKEREKKVPAKKISKVGLRRITTQYKWNDSEVMDSIRIGSYTGIISDIGVVSIPLQYGKPEDVLKRDPTNLVALSHLLTEEMRENSVPRPGFSISSDQRFEENQIYYNRLYDYYKFYLGKWKQLLEIALKKKNARKQTVDYIREYTDYVKDKLDEAQGQMSKYNRVAAVTNAMTSLASQLNALSSSMESATREDYTPLESGKSFSPSGKSSGNDEGFSLSEQTSYNRDKRTYERYDSQLASHFAGNQTMSLSSVRNAQGSMKSLRAKWEKRGKSFPKSANEDR